MNNLNEKQNSLQLLNLLKLQRYKYNKVSQLSTTNFIFSVIIPILLSIIGLFNIPDNFVSYINYIGAICVFVCLWLSTKIKEKKECAAQVQYVFDITLFEFKQNKFICNSSLTEMQAEALNKNVQDIKGLENWYSINNSLDIKDAIFSCQQQNIRWDKKLRKMFLSSVISIGFFSVFIIISIAILKNLNFNILWSYLFLLMPIITYCTTFIFATIYNLKEQKQLALVINNYKSKNNILLKELNAFEEKIFHYRKELIKIPNWFFNILRNSMQKEADNYSKCESNNNTKKKS